MAFATKASLANDVDDDLPRMRPSAMLEKVNALPRAE